VDDKDVDRFLSFVLSLIVVK